MNKEIKFNNDTEMNLYCDLLKVAYNVYKSQNDGMICGSAAEEIRDKMFMVIKNANIL